MDHLSKDIQGILRAGCGLRFFYALILCRESPPQFSSCQKMKLLKKTDC